jgi:hypothetical protein
LFIAVLTVYLEASQRIMPGVNDNSLLLALFKLSSIDDLDLFMSRFNCFVMKMESALASFESDRCYELKRLIRNFDDSEVDVL